MAGGIYLSIDASEVTAELNRLAGLMKPEVFQRGVVRVYARTGQHVRQILKQDLPQQYVIKPGEVGSAVGSARISGWSCSIPVRGAKRKIGPQFSASGGAHGWQSLKRKYRVNAKIVKSGASTLPGSMASYGGQPPFRNLGSKLMPQTYTRAGKARGPILPVSGIAIPQMPTNRSEADVQKDIMDYMKKRIEHEFSRILAGH